MKNVQQSFPAVSALCLTLSTIAGFAEAQTQVQTQTPAPVVTTVPPKTAVLVPAPAKPTVVVATPAKGLVTAAPAPAPAPVTPLRLATPAKTDTVCGPAVTTPLNGCAAPVRRAPRVRRAVVAARAVPVVYAATQQLTIALGEIKLLPVPGKVTRVALGTGTVLSATSIDKHLLLIGEQVGDTSLMVWAGGMVQSYRVQVVAVPLRVVREKVEALVGDNKAITINQVGPDLILSGVAHKDVLTRLTNMLGSTPNVINNIAQDQGTSYTRSVLFRLTFVEVKRSLLEQIGVDWANSSQGPTFGAQKVLNNSGKFRGIPAAEEGDNLLDNAPKFVSRAGSAGGVFFGLATTITSRLNLGVSDGDARVLASPELTARSGGKANLQVGGEVPIPLAGAFGATTVEFKPYGILFSIEPHVDATNTITAKLSTELSQIDPSVSINGIPGFITRNTATEISIKPGEIVALSGLINSELSNNIDRVPGLSRIPIFGRLFRSDDFRNRKTELVVFVEAEIIEAGDGLAKQLRERGLQSKREFERMDKSAARPAFPPVTTPLKKEQ